MAVRLEDVTGGKLAITLAMSLDPRWTTTRFKTTKLASDIALDIAKQRATAYFYELVHKPLLEAWQRFVYVNGARPSVPDMATEWDSGLDDELYAVFEPYTHIVSASWLGTVSDATPTEVAHVHRMAESFAADCWSQATYQRTPNQTLAGVGIVLDDLQAFVLSHAETQEKPMSLNDVFNKIMLNFEIDPDQLESLLDDASDDDAGVRASGAAQLGITTDDADRLAAVRAEGGSVIEGWMHMINTGVLLPVEGEPAPAPVPPPPSPGDPLELPAALVRNTMPEVPPPPSSGVASVGTVPPPPPQRGNGTVPPPPPGVNAPVVTSTGAPPPEPPAKRGRKAKAPEGPPPGTVPASALVAIKAASGLKDEDFAVKLNVSRPTFNNYLRSKGFCIPTPAQREELLALVDSKIAELTEARATLVV